MEKLQKPYLKNYNLLIVQDLWQAHYQILLPNFLEEFMKSYANIDMIIKNANHVELNTKIISVVLNTQTLYTALEISHNK